jgi:hypothetical protein
LLQWTCGAQNAHARLRQLRKRSRCRWQCCCHIKCDMHGDNTPQMVAPPSGRGNVWHRSLWQCYSTCERQWFDLGTNMTITGADEVTRLARPLASGKKNSHPQRKGHSSGEAGGTSSAGAPQGPPGVRLCAGNDGSEVGKTWTVASQHAIPPSARNCHCH